MQRKPKESAGSESGAQPTVKRVQNESTPHEEEAMASVDAESEPSTIQRAPAQVTAPEVPKRPAPHSSLAASVLEGEEAPQPTVGQGQEREPEAQSHGSVPTGLPDLAVDAGLVQRLSARTEVAIQRKPASTRAEETVVQPPSPPEPATEAPGSDASGPSPARTPPAAPLSVASRTLPRQTDALARTREARPRAPVRVDLPVAPRPAVVQRTALRPETETGTSPEPIGAPTMTLDAQPPSIMPTWPPSTVIQRAPSAEPVTESRTLEETPEPLPEDLISLLEDGDLMQLAREVLPIVKRLLRTELERRSQPDLEW
jgi:hypothetical protein